MVAWHFAPGHSATLLDVTEIPAEADIGCPAETIFDLIIDFRGQDRWLARSSAYHGTMEVSTDPVTLGTTYREPGPFGVRHGRVTEFDRPAAITFHQPMTMRLHAGTVDVVMRYTLTPRDGSTRVKRLVTLRIPWSLKVLRPVLIRAFRTESARTLTALKAHAETPGPV
jgi:uncharacterized protein YndB with AHSA1/START domain